MDWDDGFTLRDEANAIVACAFRNGFIEQLHAGEHSELLEDDRFSRIADSEMKTLMIQASSKVAELLKLKADNPETYQEFIRKKWLGYCTNWER